jgi:diaminopimelate epimerase
VNVIKGHAYGNDFLLTPADGASGDLPSLARALCHRHHGIGADGLVLYTPRHHGATMQLLNADGSWSELSGNGVRCLAAAIAREQRMPAGTTVTIDSDAGVKTLDLLAVNGNRFEFRASMGQPTDLRQAQIPLAGETIGATVLRTGNPQCIVLGPARTSSSSRSMRPIAFAS